MRCSIFVRLCGVGLCAVALLVARVQAVSESTGGRERIAFNQGWRFHKGEVPGTPAGLLEYRKIKPWLLPAANDFLETVRVRTAVPAGIQGLPHMVAEYDDSGWRSLDLPHDWGVEAGFEQKLPSETGKLPWWGVAWYRKRFDLSAAEAGGARRVYLDIDGAMSHAVVWCNGKLVGGWPYGYTSFRLDLTPYLRAGENAIAIRLDNPKESSRWYPGGGIYRNVWLVKTSPVHVAQWGTRVTASLEPKGEAIVVITTDVDNKTNRPVGAKVASALFCVETKSDGSERLKPAGEIQLQTSATRVDCAGAKPMPKGTRAIAAGGNETITESFYLKKPRLWDTATPHRYAAITTVQTEDGKEIDQYKTYFGIRTAKFTVHDGFHLNGKRVQLQGVCMHHDLGALGTALNPRALERQLDILQAMGVNAVRTAHNPPAPELLTLADKRGILIIDEFADMWAARKKNNDYARHFKDWGEADLRALIKRDRNHPSVIAWSTGNEVMEQYRNEGPALAQRLTRIAHEADPTRPTTTGNNNFRTATNGFAKGSDIYGANYKPHTYPAIRAANPTLPIYSSESASCISSRGEYFFPVSKADPGGIPPGKPQDKGRVAPSNEIEKGKNGGCSDYHVSSYDLSAPAWGFPPDIEFAGLDHAPYVAGEFVWTGFDYLGEPTPYNADTTNLLNFHNPEDKARAAAELKRLGKLPVPSRSSYFGIIDLAGFPKDRYYIYQARWRPNHPVAHILPHWNWPERTGQTTPVHLYTNADEAELFLNGTSQGRQKRHPNQYRFRWDEVKHTPGELKVTTWKNGKPWATATTRTTGPATRLDATADRLKIVADGTDLAFVTLRITDANGQTVPRSKKPIQLRLEGPGEIVATDNGDPTDHTPFKSPHRRAFNGLALAIIKARPNQKGTLTLHAQSEGLTPAKIEIRVE